MRKFLMALAAGAAAFAAQPASADTVCEWMEVALKLDTAARGAGYPSPEQARAATRAAIAMFEALNAIDPRYRSYLGFEEADGSASQDAAAATAAYRVLVHHHPGQKTALDESYAMAMSVVPEGAPREAGKRIGEAAAAAALEAGGIDPSVAQKPYRPRTSAGVWVPVELPSMEPWWAAFRPWVVPSPEALRPPPPVALGSARWAKDYEEVRRLGGKHSSERTPHQTLIANHRQALSMMPSLRLVADAPGRTPVRNARMFALYQMAFDDSVQAMILAKLHYDFWRPITAIRNGDEDGNDDTPADAGWEPLLYTPNFPEYPCGHCTVAAAAAEVMTAETGPNPPGGARAVSMIMPNVVVQTAPSWDQLAQEISDSRIYGGVHYRFSNEAGEEIGRKAARMVLEKAMRPLEE